MEDNEKKAMDLMAEAKRKTGGGKGFFGFLTGSRGEEAVELYQRAANLFKMAKKWSSAGHAFCEAASLHLKSGTRHEAATSYVDAATCYRKSDANEAISCLLKAIEIYTDMGRFTMAAKHHQTIAELYETEVLDLEKAIQHYEKAADYFKGEESSSSANKCMLKVAQFAAQLEKYDRAIQIYEQVAANSLESSLLKYSAKEYFFRSLICHLCVDAHNAQIALQKYEEMYPAFQDSREAKLIKSLIGCIEEQNADGFSEAVKNYDTVSRMDQWYTTLLLRVKKGLNENPDLR
ncbi:unnamed protein product [Darwinula stevensoni]|uniref:Alpha-soluble NSF attachment protein n=1 Tax=Darwinula stevensoni TaxID=69355 RepID=A0A7R8XE32_9CRUS|nr:unnamed protein product [Darwinula stevensoni]CAG0894074.1 unnamed protein product [Darwinula stevensoni]